MSTRRAKRWIQLCVLSMCLSLSLYFGAGEHLELPRIAISRPFVQRAIKSLTLDEPECRAAFPGLFKSIDDTVSLGPFPLKQARASGLFQARIKDGQLSIINWDDRDSLPTNLRQARTAALHQIHRAILTSPSQLPDTVFAVNIEDQPTGTAWSYSRPAYAAPSSGNPPIVRAFLMPHFAFWAWPLPFVGSFYRAAGAIQAIETSLPFGQKSSRPVWRGTKDYNSVYNPKMRDNLINITKDAAWADVEELHWTQVDTGMGSQTVATNSLNIEDFCKYKYVLHTEGITYSGRFQFLQLCKSIILTPPIVWMQHTTHLIQPLFSSDLPLFDPTLRTKETWEPAEGERMAWPQHYRPENANIVFIKPDWSDLEDSIKWLEDHGDIAEGIASRQRKLFADRGYLSPAAETCYWRELIRGWSRAVQTTSQGWEERQGVGWEAFSMI